VIKKPFPCKKQPNTNILPQNKKSPRFEVE
jgi:hypothetical protein